MNGRTIDWSELAADTVKRVQAKETHECILNDLYYGVQAELEYQGFPATSRIIEQLAAGLFHCVMTMHNTLNLNNLTQLLVLVVPPGKSPLWTFVCQCWMSNVLSRAERDTQRRPALERDYAETRFPYVIFAAVAPAMGM